MDRVNEGHRYARARQALHHTFMTMTSTSMSDSTPSRRAESPKQTQITVVLDISNTSNEQVTAALCNSAIAPSDQPQPTAECSNKTSEGDPSEITDQPLSKKALKRKLKAERFQASKLERRAREKAAKKEKKQARKERMENGEQNSADEEAEEREKKRRKIRKVDKEEGSRKGEVFNARVVVDLGFDEMMSEKVCFNSFTPGYPSLSSTRQEINSLSSQLAYTYAANRRTSKPFASILFAPLNGRLRSRMDGDNEAVYRRWTNCEWWEDNFDMLWYRFEPEEEDKRDVRILGDIVGKERASCRKEELVYLTADSGDILEELKEGETYVLGGIVDHNRYKVSFIRNLNYVMSQMELDSHL